MLSLTGCMEGGGVGKPWEARELTPYRNYLGRSHTTPWLWSFFCRWQRTPLGDMYSQVWGLSSMGLSVDGSRRDRGDSKGLLPCWNSKDVD